MILPGACVRRDAPGYNRQRIFAAAFLVGRRKQRGVLRVGDYVLRLDLREGALEGLLVKQE